jgi:hypothetical protein
MKPIFLLSITFFFAFHSYAQNDAAKKSSPVVQPKVHQEKNSIAVQNKSKADLNNKESVKVIDGRKVIVDPNGVQSFISPDEKNNSSGNQPVKNESKK